MPAPLIPADLLARTQIISGLRQLADYLQAHPGVPVNEYGWDLHAFATTDSDPAGRADVDEIASASASRPATTPPTAATTPRPRHSAGSPTSSSTSPPAAAPPTRR